MKILIIYQYFGTPKGSWSTRFYEFCKRWVSRGVDVNVITSPYEKSDLKTHGLISEQVIDGIKLTVINTADNNRKGKIVRAANSILFSIIACYYALTKEYDLLLASSGPITVGLPMIVAKKIRKKKSIFELRDLWPSGAIELGLISNPLLIRLGYFFERLCYESADQVVCASVGQQQNISRRFSSITPVVIPNASDNTLFGSEPKGDLPPAFTNRILLTHIGSLGLIHNVSYWLDVAKEVTIIMKSLPISFIFIGEGAERAFLENRVMNEGITNIHFLGLMPKNDLPVWVHNSYATLFSTLATETQDACSPNKIFDSFAAGIPIIQTSRGWIHELVASHGCGINVPIDNPTIAAQQIVAYLENRQLRNQHAQNSKELAIGMFDRELLANKYHQIVTNLISQDKDKI